MTITGLKKTVGAFSLSIEKMSLRRPGIYGLIGPNGCGKSTTSKLLAGLLRPDAGVIDCEGLDSRDITLLLPKPYMMDDTVYNNLVYPLRVRGIAPDPVMCSEYLDLTGLTGRRKQKARSLSSGERQKLALARALIFKPKFIIADEALTDLDIDSLERFERLIQETQKRDSVTWLIISHQLSHIQRMCEYIFFMEDGRLQAEGPAADMLLRPDNPRVCRYLRCEAFIEEEQKP